MPTPITDATLALKSNPEKTQQALQKVTCEGAFLLVNFVTFSVEVTCVYTANNLCNYQ